MQPLQRAHLLLLLTLLILCMPFGQMDNLDAKDPKPVTTLPSNQSISQSSLSPPWGSPSLFSLTLGLAAAFFLGLR